MQYAFKGFLAIKLEIESGILLLRNTIFQILNRRNVVENAVNYRGPIIII